MTKINFTRLSDVQALAFRFCGQIVHISRFSPYILDYCESPGCYFIESIIYTHDGQLQMGVEVEADKVEFYALSDLEITHIVNDSAFCH